MEEFIKSLLGEETLTDEIKLSMLKTYERKWFKSMCTKFQSNEDLMDNNNSLLIIQKAVGELETKVML